jgi:hypothetical protein
MNLCQFEWDLCHAQASDSLNDLHRHLLLHTHLYKLEDINIWGQQANTHAAAIIRKVKHNVTEAGKATTTHGLHLAGYAEHLERMVGRVSFLCSSQLTCTECQRVRQVNPKATGHSLGSGRCRVPQLGRFLQMVSNSNFLADMVFSILSSVLHIEWCKARAIHELLDSKYSFYWRRCSMSKHSFLGMLHGGCHIPYIRASHPKFRMSDPIRSDPQIRTGSVTISFFIHILFI